MAYESITYGIAGCELDGMQHVKKRPSLSTPRLVDIYDTTIEYRRGFRADREFFRMTDI